MSPTKPVPELQRNIGSIYELCRKSCEPVYITRNGKADLMVVDAAAFGERGMLQRTAYEREMRLLDSIMRGWVQAQASNLKLLSQVRAERGGA